MILAAGTSRRMGEGTKKEYLPLGDRPVLHNTAKAFLDTSLFTHIAIAVPPGGEDEARAVLGDLILPGPGRPAFLFIPGGDTRQQSVFNSLQALAETGIDTVLIHDGARPWVSPGLIRRVAVEARSRGAAAPVIPVVDTVKILDSRGYIREHLVRDRIGAIQTPQGFHFPAILEAHERARQDQRVYTDDTEIYGLHVGEVFTVPGELTNRKITFPGDLEAAR